ncbi:PIN-like domain-containing protein [Chryseobacterium lineare]
MDRNSIKPYRLTDEKEAILWRDAIIVFDSSALLDLYFSPKSEREKIDKEIFNELKDRLWLPNHVQYEYLKNRENIIKKPITEKYEPLRKKIQNLSNNPKFEISKRIDEIIRETKKGDKHPHLKQEGLNDFKTIVEDFVKKVEDFHRQTEDFQKDILSEITIAEEEIKEVENDDDVLDSLETHFKVGREYTFNEIIEITKEGKHRYEFKIPPGYGDFYNGEKKGTQIFGDLIIWKQILEYSKEVEKPVIFITNDITKDDDWGYIDKGATEPRIYSPREELIKEIKDNSSVDFWMYNLPQFLFQANKHLKSTINDETIQNFFQFINTKKSKSDYLKFKCSSCGRIHRYDKSEFNLDFGCVSSNERNMGTENQYEAEEHFECSCGNEIEVKFELWEYPAGVHNYDSIEIENAKLLESFYFTIDFYNDEYEDEHDFITCHICDGNKDNTGNFVILDRHMNLDNEFLDKIPESEYLSVSYGNCDWCNSLHIECPKCNSVTSIDDYQANENIECEGGCGLIFKMDNSNDRDNIGEFDLKLVDVRINQCVSCGENFVDESGTEICEKCEEKYDQK